MIVVDNSLFSLLIVAVLMLLSFGYSSPKARSIHVLQLLLSAQVLQRQFNAEKGGSWHQHAAFGLACLLLLGMFANALIIEMNVLGSNHLSPLSSLKLSLLIFTGVAVQFILVALAMNVVKIADASHNLSKNYLLPVNNQNKSRNKYTKVLIYFDQDPVKCEKRISFDGNQWIEM